MYNFEWNITKNLYQLFDVNSIQRDTFASQMQLETIAEGPRRRLSHVVTIIQVYFGLHCMSLSKKSVATFMRATVRARWREYAPRTTQYEYDELRTAEQITTVDGRALVKHKWRSDPRASSTRLRVNIYETFNARKGKACSLARELHGASFTQDVLERSQSKRKRKGRAPGKIDYGFAM